MARGTLMAGTAQDNIAPVEVPIPESGPLTLMNRQYIVVDEPAEIDGTSRVVQFTADLSEMGMGRKYPTADKVVIFWAHSDGLTFGEGGAGFEFYIFADGSCKIWKADGTPYTGQMGGNYMIEGAPPFYNPGEYPRWSIQLTPMTVPYGYGADYLFCTLAGQTLEGVRHTDFYYFDCYAAQADSANYTIFKFPFTIGFGAIPRNNAGWVGIGATYQEEIPL